MLYPKIAEYTLFSNILSSFIKVDYILGHETNFNKFKKLVIDTSLISMKLGNKKIIRKKYIRNIRLTVLNNWFKEGLNKNVKFFRSEQ